MATGFKASVGELYRQVCGARTLEFEQFSAALPPAVRKRLRLSGGSGQPLTRGYASPRGAQRTPVDRTEDDPSEIGSSEAHPPRQVSQGGDTRQALVSCPD